MQLDRASNFWPHLKVLMARTAPTNHAPTPTLPPPTTPPFIFPPPTLPPSTSPPHALPALTFPSSTLPTPTLPRIPVLRSTVRPPPTSRLRPAFTHPTTGGLRLPSSPSTRTTRTRTTTTAHSAIAKPTRTHRRNVRRTPPHVPVFDAVFEAEGADRDVLAQFMDGRRAYRAPLLANNGSNAGSKSHTTSTQVFVTDNQIQTHLPPASEGGSSFQQMLFPPTPTP